MVTGNATYAVGSISEDGAENILEEFPSLEGAAEQLEVLAENSTNANITGYFVAFVYRAEGAEPDSEPEHIEHYSGITLEQ